MEEKMLKAFGGRVRELRKKKGFSQESFAHEAGIERSYMGAIERGERNLTFLKIVRIARALNLNISQLLSTL